MNEYLTKITKLLDQAADDLDADVYEELLTELQEDLDGRYDDDSGDEDDDDE